MFVDKVKIFCKAGNGGDGCKNFMHATHVMNGGPDGGNGGHGGNIVFIVDEGMNNLIDFYYQKHYRAKDGEKGGRNNKYGKTADDMYIKVPKGTVVRDATNGEIVADMALVKDGEIRVLKGGRGGRGNARFANAVRQAPTFYETGEITKEYEIMLELKTIADVGLLGFPNVGKSRLLSIITNAKPKIADYEFTTLSPNLGVATIYDDKIMVADIPGIIEGASEGKGLGFEFLRHIERTRMLLHVVDGSGINGRDPIDDFETINRELAVYNKEVAALKQVVVINKMDLVYTDEQKDVIKEFKNKFGGEYPIVEISCATREGVDDLMKAVHKTLQTVEIVEEFVEYDYKIDNINKKEFHVQRTGHESYTVSGPYVDHLIRGIVLSEPESFNYFQRRLRNDGVIDKLTEKGMKDGDTVSVKGFEFTYEE